MSFPRFDVFLLAAPKDYSKIEFCLDGIIENVEGFQNVYLCTPTPIDKAKYNLLKCPIHYRLDKQVLPADPKRWKYRPNWIYQQFIKLFQNETENNWYLVVDIDTIIIKPMKFFSKYDDYSLFFPIWRTSWEQNHKPYYEFNKRMFGYGRVYNHSFLADMGFYNKMFINEMLGRFGYSSKSFIEKSYMIINNKCMPSEADIYMSYMVKYHPDFYKFQELKVNQNAKEGKNPTEQLWSRQDIIDQIASVKKSGVDYDTIAIHSWVDVSHDSWY